MTTIIIISSALMLFAIYFYCEGMKLTLISVNKNVNGKKPIIYSIGLNFMSLCVITLYFNIPWLLILTIIILLLQLLIYKYYNKQRIANIDILNNSNGVIRDYEIPIKWLNNSQIKSDLLINNDDICITYVNKLPIATTKYKYYALFPNNKRKLVRIGSMTHKKINQLYTKN